MQFTADCRQKNIARYSCSFDAICERKVGERHSMDTAQIPYRRLRFCVYVLFRRKCSWGRKSQVEIYTELEAMEKEIKWGRKLEMINE